MTDTAPNGSLPTAQSFVGSIGINAHAGFAWDGYDDARLVLKSLNYLGIDTIRDGLGSLPQAAPVLSALAASGIKFDFGVGSSVPATGAAGLDTYVKSLAAFQAANPGSIVALEGLNEVNIQSFSYNGSSSMSAAAAFQKALYAAIKSNATLKDVPVYNLTVGKDDAEDHRALGDLGGASDFANAHAYVSTNSNVTSSFDVTLGLAKSNAVGKPVVITETGYTSLKSADNLGVNDSAQAKLILNALVTAFKDGVSKTYIYELLDRSDDPGNTDREAHFGLFNADGSPKLAATAVHNLTTILNDNGTGGSMPTGALGYSLSGLPSSNAGSMTLAKSNGAYDLVVWAAPKVWNDATDTEIANPVTPVKVLLDKAAGTVAVYDPMKGTAPIATYSNVKEITLPVSDHPLIVEVGGTGLMPKAQAAVPANHSLTAASFMAQIDDLAQSTTLKTITLTDTKVIPVASVETMKSMIAGDKAVLSKIVGGYQFSITQSTSTWSRKEVYDADGKLFSTTNEGIKDGLVFTHQTKFADGTLDVVNYKDGVKLNEILTRADGSKELYTYNIKGQEHATEHSSYDKAGAMTRFERLRADDTPTFTEVRSGGAKTVSWYDAKGVVTKEVAYPTDGSVATTIYVDGVKSRVYVANADKSQDNFAYNLTGRSYTSEQQKLDATGKIVEIVRSHKDGTLDYTWKLNADGSKTTTNFDASGKKTTVVTIATGGQTSTDFFAASGAMTKQVVQKPDGYFATTVYANNAKTALYVENGDGTKLTTSYAANGSKTSEVATAKDGTVTTVLYANDAVSRKYVAYADKSQDNYAYNITAKSYATEMQKVDAAGRVVEVVRSHKDGTLDYTWKLEADGDKVTTTYDSAGRKLGIVTNEADGDVASSFFDAATGALAKTVAQGGGTTVTTTFANGVKSAVASRFADGSVANDTFDAKGTITGSVRKGADGHTETAVYDAGNLSRLYVTNADGTKENTAFGIKNQTYVKEVQKLDKAGTVIEVTRTHADGSLDYHMAVAASGTKTTSSYTPAGVKAADVMVHADGSSDVFKFVIADRPGVQQHESYNAAKAMTLLDVTNADGTHNISARAAGLTLVGSKGDDVVSLYGSDKFVFTGGNDKVSNFHADDAASNHDVIQIAKALATSFASLQVTQSGADALVKINSHDSVLLKNVDVHKVTAGDFLFV